MKKINQKHNVCNMEKSKMSLYINKSRMLQLHELGNHSRKTSYFISRCKPESISTIKTIYIHQN